MSEATSRQPAAARRARPAPPPDTSAGDSSGPGDSCPAEDDAAAALEAYVAAMVAAAPPLTSEQRDRLAVLFHTRPRRLRAKAPTRRARACPARTGRGRATASAPAAGEGAGALTRSPLPVVPAGHQARGDQRGGPSDRHHVQDDHHRDAFGPAQEGDDRRQGVHHREGADQPDPEQPRPGPGGCPAHSPSPPRAPCQFTPPPSRPGHARWPARWRR
jgi:hypothetical protein